MLTLDEILRKSFGCGKPFLKKPKVCGYFVGETPEPCYEYMTRSGGRAYGKLVDLLYSLEQLLGDGFDANHWITELDRIVNDEDY
jgi:hypothetical protein